MRKKLYNFSNHEKSSFKKLTEDAVSGCPEIDFAYFYGSFIEDLPFHDIDIGAYALGIKESESTEYGLELSERLSIQIKCPVDLRIINFAPVTFLYHVFRGELFFTRDDDLRSRVVELTISKYLDMKPLIKRAFKESFS